jgi:hypothetical protein
MYSTRAFTESRVTVSNRVAPDTSGRPLRGNVAKKSPATRVCPSSGTSKGREDVSRSPTELRSHREEPTGFVTGGLSPARTSTSKKRVRQREIVPRQGLPRVVKTFRALPLSYGPIREEPTGFEPATSTGIGCNPHEHLPGPRARSRTVPPPRRCGGPSEGMRLLAKTRT